MKLTKDEAQLILDKRAEEAKEKPNLPEGEVLAHSTKEGFKFEANADGEIVVRHTVATFESALKSFDDAGDTQAKMLLGLNIAMLLEKTIK